MVVSKHESFRRIIVHVAVTIVAVSAVIVVVTQGVAGGIVYRAQLVT